MIVADDFDLLADHLTNDALFDQPLTEKHLASDGVRIV
jgi:hypothetical protein